MKTYFSFILLAVVFSFSSCKKDIEYVDRIVEKEVVTPGPGEISLKFDAVYDDQDFELNKKYLYSLTNDSGSYNLQYEFSKLRYWISNVKLINEAGEEFLVPDSYYLLEETGEISVQDGSYNKIYPATKREVINIKGIPIGDYKSIKFSLGIDSKYNDNLALQVGELSSLNGMANEQWMWLTSYIFTSVAGKMTWLNETPETRNFFWDTGSNDNFKEVTIDLGKSVKISSNYSAEVNFKTNVKEIIDLEYPWNNSVIGATKPDLMSNLTSNYSQKAIQFLSADSKEK